jgi:trehalose/maltose hydrolase-like predicted phosphorylase
VLFGATECASLLHIRARVGAARDSPGDATRPMRNGAARSPEVDSRPAGLTLPPELDRAFRLVACDWDGTAVTSRSADATRVVGLIDRLLGAGARVAVITGTSLDNVARQLDHGITPEHAGRLFVSANRGSEVFGFDRRGAPRLLFRRQATLDEERLLDAVADGVKERLERVTGLPFAVVRSRLNRRKIDLIPEAAFSDPPKSMIGELLAATEARLRGAGLRGGVREAFAMTEARAREVGLAGARVTSDVKHVEVGLTDKADAMAFLCRCVAAPLHIAAADVLIAGDEFGPIAGFEGSDYRMLAVPDVAGAVAISVGPEPAGAPPPVLHLGGGPDRFCEVIAHLLALDAARSPFTVPCDAAWVVEEPGFDVAREHEIESLLSIANGYVGSRASIAEGTRVSRPATFLAGAFEPSADLARVPELVITPDWGRLRFTIEGEPFSVENGAMLHHRRVLDMRRGLLLREGLERGPSGHVTALRTIHLASLAERHLLVEGVEIRPQNYSGTVRIDTILSGDVRSESGASHWAGFEGSCGFEGPSLVGRTHGGLVVALASHLEVQPEASGEAHVHCRADAIRASEHVELPVRLGEARELYRTVALVSSRDAADPGGAAELLRRAASAEPLASRIARHEAAWAERWRRADVHIDGAPGLERALRFALYHLIAAANPEDPRCSVGARSLSGEAYRGHVFWDTEIFMLPFYAHAYPEAAQALVGYRHVTLPGAQRKAIASGYRGALYAWESADTGDETTPAAVISPFGEILRVLSGEQEHHISADVAYGVCSYARSTGDASFLLGPGQQILIETARFWASRVALGGDGLFHVRCVIGPDEYHEAVDDNAFTNWMARFNLTCAADAVDASPAAASRWGATREEASTWRRIAGAMYLGLDERTGVVEQFAGFFGLEPVDLAALGTQHVPADLVLGKARTQRSQVVKQADVVMLVALLWDALPPAVRRASFLYYEPRTAHGSSLSPGVHALVAARLGLLDEAARYLEQTAAIDLGNTMGNAAGGVHAAALGSLWQAVVLGAGGVRPAPDDVGALLIEPHLLPGWEALVFPLSWRGSQLEFVVEPGAIELAVIDGASAVTIRALGPDGGAVEVRAEPGTRHAARRSGEGFRAWEATS